MILDKWFEWLMFLLFALGGLCTIYKAGGAERPKKTQLILAAIVNALFAIGVYLRWLQ